jgi:hypothetical protein
LARPLLSVVSVSGENLNAMIESFQALPPDRQDAVKNWMMIQRLIAEHTGVTREEWFGLIQEALDHPLDFSFLEERTTNGEGADLEQIDGARQMLGDRAAKTALEGKGIVETSKKGALEQELFQRFQLQKINFEKDRRNRGKKK